MPTALILGCAECVWDDARAALALFNPDAIIACKDMMILWPGRIDYGATLHPDRTPGYLRDRKKLGRAADFPVWSHRTIGTQNFVHAVTPDWQGSTGLFAVKVARLEGFDGIVLAGIPIQDKDGHVVRRRKWTAAQIFQKGWKQRFPEIQPYVRSMSGWTKELLGLPDPEWLREHGAAQPDHEVVKLLPGYEVANTTDHEVVQR